MILGITGHRPKKLYGYNDAHPGNMFIINAIGDFFKEHKPEKVITGMALGVDQWAAQWCIKLEIPFMAAIPMKGQEKMWPADSQKKYHWMISKAVAISESKENESIFTAMDDRNKYIVDNSDQMLGVFGGQPGGTRNCLEYAKKKEKHIDIINPGDYYKT